MCSDGVGVGSSVRGCFRWSCLSCLLGLGLSLSRTSCPSVRLLMLWGSSGSQTKSSRAATEPYDTVPRPQAQVAKGCAMPSPAIPPTAPTASRLPAPLPTPQQILSWALAQAMCCMGYLLVTPQIQARDFFLWNAFQGSQRIPKSCLTSPLPNILCYRCLGDWSRGVASLEQTLTPVPH